jgi:hypothetical protein
MKLRNNTPLQTSILIAIVIALCVLCDTQKNVNQDDVQPLSQHDSTILANYELKH